MIVEGEAVPSCRLPAADVEGREVTTVEGVAGDGRLHPVQEAFVEEQAAQCGFCTAGLVMAAKALLDRGPDPDETEIRRALAVHVCRCGAHPRVIRAIRRAAEAMS